MKIDDFPINIEVISMWYFILYSVKDIIIWNV